MSEPRLPKPELVDLWHFVIGLFATIFPIPVVGLIVAIIYIVYQVFEKESTLRTIRDLAIFLCGTLIGYLARQCF